MVILFSSSSNIVQDACLFDLFFFGLFLAAAAGTQLLCFAERQ